MLHGDSKLAFSQARSVCVVEAGDLAVIESTDVVNYVAQLVQQADNAAA